MVLSEGTTEKKSQVTPPGIDLGTFRLVAQCLNHYATPGPNHSSRFKQLAVYKKVLNGGSASCVCVCVCVCVNIILH